MKSKSLILLMLSIGFGIVAAIGISQVMKQPAVASATEAPRGPILLAAGDLDLNAKLTEENVKLENWVIDTIPPDAITSLDEIADMVTTTRMYPGMPIVSSAIQHKNESQSEPIPANMRVVAVRVSADDTIGNLLNPGHRVDVIGVIKKRDPKSGQQTSTSKTFLKALRVYSIDSKTRVDNSESGKGNANRSSIVGLLVTEKQSEALVFVQDVGSIKLVLRGDDAANTGGVEAIDELKDELLAGDAGDVSTQAPSSRSNVKSVMEIWLGGESSKTEFDNRGSRVRIDESAEGELTPGGEGSGSRESRGGNYADPEGRGDSDRGIDDDQYWDQ